MVSLIWYNIRKKRETYPSSFLREENSTKGKGKGKLYVYERDILCLPHSFLQHGDIIQIPRNKAHPPFPCSEQTCWKNPASI